MNSLSPEAFIFTAPCPPASYSPKLEGQIPDYVQGTYYLNGPACFEAGSVTRRHWLDGDGLARSLQIGREGMTYRSAYVATRKYREEQAEGAALYRTFGWAGPDDRLRGKMLLETPANVSLYRFAGRLLAFGEQALPYELDPTTLATLSECDFGGAFNTMTPFSAHPKLDDGLGRLCSFSIAYLGGVAKLNYYEIDREFKPVIRTSGVLPDCNYIHDFAISPRYAIFHLAPYRLDIRRFIGGQVSLQEAMSWDPEGPCSLKILDRRSGKQVAELALTRKSFCLHTINAFEKDGQLVVDLVDTPVPFFDQYQANPYMFTELQSCATVRYAIDQRDWSIVTSQVHEAPIHFDFPNPGGPWFQQSYRYFWGLGMPSHPSPAPKFYNRVFRFDWDNPGYENGWQAEPGQFLGGEPLIVTDPNDPNKATVITQGFEPETGRSSYNFFDAHQLEAGPIAKATLPFYDPLGFHTSWNQNK